MALRLSLKKLCERENSLLVECFGFKFISQDACRHRYTACGGTRPNGPHIPRDGHVARHETGATSKTRDHAHTNDGRHATLPAILRAEGGHTRRPAWPPRPPPPGGAHSACSGGKTAPRAHSQSAHMKLEWLYTHGMGANWRGFLERRVFARNVRRDSRIGDYTARVDGG